MRAFYLYDPWEMEYLKFSTFQQIFDDSCVCISIFLSTQVPCEFARLLDLKEDKFIEMALLKASEAREASCVFMFWGK